MGLDDTAPTYSPRQTSQWKADEEYGQAMAAAQWAMTTTNLLGSTIGAGMAGYNEYAQSQQSVTVTGQLMGHEARTTVPMGDPNGRDAPTGLMKELGYGRGYRYAHNEAEGVAEMSCLPAHLEGRQYYKPTDRGLEGKIKEALERAKTIKNKNS